MPGEAEETRENKHYILHQKRDLKLTSLKFKIGVRTTWLLKYEVSENLHKTPIIYDYNRSISLKIDMNLSSDNALSLPSYNDGSFSTVHLNYNCTTAAKRHYPSVT